MKRKIVWMEIHDPRIQKIEDQMAPEGFEIIRPQSRTDREEHLQLMQEADYVIAGGIPIPADYIAQAPKLKMIQKWGIGLDKVDCRRAEQEGIGVCITAGENAVPVAELAVGLMIAVNRRIPYVDASMRKGRWMKTEIRPQCYMMRDKVVGLLGIGNIARHVAELLKGFHCSMIYYDVARLPKEEEERLGVSYVNFDTLIQKADILSLHLPLTPQTRGMIGAEEFRKMKNTAILVNTSRGGVVDESALYEALKSGEIRGAGLDTFEMEPVSPDLPLLRLENVVLSSHCGGGVVDNVVNMTRHAYGNIQRFDRGEPIDERDVVVPAGREADVLCSV
ncbi:2-hydroxyacid dehydrogenase [Hominifimenecus sp. rT4P-3]|uniref:2-hydroxyacid dehydrogenase n=1 Tax=Hominifimenecus sp. rT4P-3 TaxID=3242979 RepID=UPI003DA446AD